MEKKDWRKRIEIEISYGEPVVKVDGKYVEKREVLENFISQELEKAREEGIEEGWKSCEEYRILLNRALIGDVNFAEKDELKAMENRFESLRRKYS